MRDSKSESAYRLISIGYVAENKLRTEHTVEISLTELSPMLNGELKSNVDTINFDGLDAKGNPYAGQVNISNTIMATWKGGLGNRISSPDVRRGDRVEIYQFGNTDKYYWLPLETVGFDLKKRETITEAFSNTTDESVHDYSEDSHWVREVSTHDKVVTYMKTNKADGEKFAYTDQLNVKDGTRSFGDDIGNYTQMDSNENRHEIKNANGYGIDVHKGKIIINCEDLVLDASKSITIKSAKGNITIPLTEWVGNTNKDGNLNLSGNMESSGGNYTFNGPVATNGSLTNNGKNVGDNHSHKGVRTGDGNTGPVV